MITFSNNNLELCRRWVILGVIMLAIAGIVSLAVVFLRLPFFSSVINVREIFDLALVVHVDLSVLIWMYSIIGVVSSLAVSYNNWFKRINTFLWYLTLIAALALVCAIFVPDTIAIKSNYIPVLNNKLFLTGLCIFFTVIVCNSLISSMHIKVDKQPVFIQIGALGTSIISTVAVMCFVMAYKSIPYSWYANDPHQAYENLFWGGGHLLQFAFVQVFLLAYAIMIYTNEENFLLNSRTLSLILIINTLLALGAPIIYLFYTSSDAKLITFFTWHMRIAGAVVPLFIIVVSLLNIKELIKRSNHALLLAIILFVYGNTLGIGVIQGNVTIPAHYHGSIVGMTIAFMGFIYWLFPQLGFNEISTRVKNVQIYIYSFGQMLHITGLKWLGGYGALRKTPSIPDISSVIAKVSFIVGGLVAVIGGSLFFIITLVYIFKYYKSLAQRNI